MAQIYHMFPIVMDNTQITAFKACPLRWFYKHCLHLKSELSVHLHFGAVYASGLEATRIAFYTQEKTEAEAIQIGQDVIRQKWQAIYKLDNLEPLTLEEISEFDPFKDYPKSFKTCRLLHKVYFAKYNLRQDEYTPLSLANPSDELDTKEGIEFSFMEELGIAHPELDVSLTFTGRADMLVNSTMLGAKSGLVFDDKTTGSYLSDNLMSQWAMRGQFTGYIWGFRKLDLPIRGALVSMASIRQLKAGIKLDFERREYPRTAFQIYSWEKQMRHTIRAMVEYYNTMIKLKKRAVDNKAKYTVAKLSPTSSHGDACYDYGRECWYLPSCQNNSLAPTRVNPNSKQFIWQPEKAGNFPLKGYIEDLGENPDDYVWMEGETTFNDVTFNF